ncbi:MAG TPA: sulfite exporter TauE/SafE family protein [Clostridia bacterium]|nr:sulfite exporter TauE/SafE family protein [Clostridia bacterium]HRX41737.1 sulfite exporter TauE/SafE family protein [Clostridia bacterium]
MVITDAIIILVTGIAAGFINVNAGGGSFITIPLLIFMGLPTAVANGTNRVALAAANIIAVHNFKKGGHFDWKLSLLLAIPATIGAIAGSFISINLPDDLYNAILGSVIIVVVLFIIVNPARFIKTPSELSGKRKVLGMFIFLLLGLYGGIIQAGVGFLIITSLFFITGYSLVRINSLKVLIVLIYMAFSLAVFIISGNVNWVYALVLSAGNGTGAFLGSRFAMKHGDKWIKAIMIIASLIMALKLLNVF